MEVRTGRAWAVSSNLLLTQPRLMVFREAGCQQHWHRRKIASTLSRNRLLSRMRTSGPPPPRHLFTTTIRALARVCRCRGCPGSDARQSSLRADTNTSWTALLLPVLSSGEGYQSIVHAFMVLRIQESLSSTRLGIRIRQSRFMPMWSRRRQPREGLGTRRSGTVLGCHCSCYSYAPSAWLLGPGFPIRPGCHALTIPRGGVHTYVSKQAGDHRCQQAGREPARRPAHWVGPLVFSAPGARASGQLGGCETSGP